MDKKPLKYRKTVTGIATHYYCNGCGMKIEKGIERCYFCKRGIRWNDEIRTNKEIGEAVKKKRKEFQLTQKQLAEKCYCSASTIKNLERGYFKKRKKVMEHYEQINEVLKEIERETKVRVNNDHN